MTDIVITFVDYNCIEWQKAYFNAKKTIHDPLIHTIDSATKTRFVNHGELKFLLRSIALYMPWIRNIYIVVDDFLIIPDWITGIIIVRHTELFKDNQSCLPTFNSQAIETVIHRIPGISEPFIYFNDDMFVGRPIELNDLIQDSKIAVLLSNSRSKTGIPSVSDLGFRCAWKNVNRLLDKQFENIIRYKLDHAPYIISPKIMEILWTTYKDDMEKTIQSRFRSIYDINVAPALHPYHALHINKAFVQDELIVKIIYLYLENKLDTVMKLNEMYIDLPHFFCLEDEDGRSDSDNAIKEFLEKIFPEKCKYECDKV